jgi:hypothetical protein
MLFRSALNMGRNIGEKMRKINQQHVYIHSLDKNP